VAIGGNMLNLHPFIEAINVDSNRAQQDGVSELQSSTVEQDTCGSDALADANGVALACDEHGQAALRCPRGYRCNSENKCCAGGMRPVRI
jgi:hypothetical protein